jgi:predicted ester cyclase
VTLGLALTSFACGGSAPPPPAATAAPPVKTAAERVKMYQDCWQQYNDKNWAAFEKCYAEQATSEAVDSTPPMTRGRAAIMERDKVFAAAFPDRRGEVVLVLANDTRMASVAVWMGTHEGDLPGPDGKPIPATKKKVGVYLAHLAETDQTGSHVVADAVYADDGTLMSQLGLLKMPARKVMAMSGAPPTVVIARNDETERANVAAFQAWMDAGNKHDWKAFDGFLADNYKLIDITQPADMNKKQSLALIQQFAKGFPDMKLATTRSWGAGDYVAVEGSFAGTNTGALPALGIAKATGKPVSARFFEVVKFQNGKAVEDWMFFNGAAFAAQLGLK